MRKLLYTLAVLTLVSSLAGCGGKSGSPATQSASGTSTVSFTIPLNKPGSQFTVAPSSSRNGVNPTVARPNFIDTYSNGIIYGYLDGQQVMNLDLSVIDWSGDSPVIAAGALNGSSTNNGSTISWTSTLTGSTLGVSATVTTVVGVSHTFGVVETNGACSGSCISSNSGYVLAEGQTSFTPLSTATDLVTLTLRGVLEAGYLCSTIDSGCPNSQGTLGADGWYHFVAIPTDENGNSVIPSAKPTDGWPTTPYANGGWSIKVTEGGVVDVQPDQADSTYQNGNLPGTETLGPFTAANPYQRPSGKYWDGEGFKFQCVTTGTAVISMQMEPNSLSAGGVAGFTYNSGNYPATGALLGTVGADTHFGNGQGLIVNCSGTTIISIN